MSSHSGAHILRDSMRLLMEGTPEDIELLDVVSALEDLTGVEDAHHVHAWALTSGRYVFSAHLRMSGEADPEALQSSALKMLRDQFGFFFVTLQLETHCLDESPAKAIDILLPAKPQNV